MRYGFARTDAELIKAEKDALDHLAQFCEEHIFYIWHMGNGSGGEIFFQITDAAKKHGLLIPATKTRPTKKRIGPRTAVACVLKYGMKCYYCGVDLNYTNITFDHAIPTSKGGINNLINLVPACSFCNMSKGDKLIGGKNEY